MKTILRAQGSKTSIEKKLALPFLALLAVLYVAIGGGTQPGSETRKNPGGPVINVPANVVTTSVLASEIGGGQETRPRSFIPNPIGGPGNEPHKRPGGPMLGVPNPVGPFSMAPLTIGGVQETRPRSFIPNHLGGSFPMCDVVVIGGNGSPLPPRCKAASPIGSPVPNNPLPTGIGGNGGSVAPRAFAYGSSFLQDCTGAFSNRPKGTGWHTDTGQRPLDEAPI